jgi:exodeoxyribonuclease X
MGTHHMNKPWTARRYAVVDVEGNGQRPPDLVELAVVPITEGIIGKPSTWLVRPPRPITPIARRFHKITDAEVADAPPVAKVADEIREALTGAVFVAHNAHVDLAVVARSVPGFAPAEAVDTLKLARCLFPGQISYRLGSLAEAFDLADGLDGELRPHRATYDALVCARLLERLCSPPDGAALTVADLHLEGGEPDADEALF